MRLARLWLLYVIPIVTGLGESLTNGISGGTVSEDILDKLALKYIKIMKRGFTSASAMTNNIAMFLKAAVVLFGLVPFLVIAALAIVIAKIGSLLFAMVEEQENKPVVYPQKGCCWA